MIETGWYTDTFKSLARQRQTAHLWGRFCQSRPVKDLSVQPCAQADAADMFGGLGKKKNRCSLCGPILSGESSECSRVQRP